MKYDPFPSSEYYREFLPASSSAVHENSSAPYSFQYSERHLQCLWFDNSMRPRTLVSSDGEQVYVDSSGRWNLEAGPDFLDATLTIGPEQRKIRGDIEVHIHPHDWINHKHAGDSRYDNVIAHVTYFPRVLPPNTLPKGVLQISLRNTLNATPGFSFENIDVTSYPYSYLPQNPAPCTLALKRYDPDQVTTLLESAGAERLRVKSVRIAEQIQEKGLHQAFYEELMYALGYKQNRIPFRRLASVLPFQAVKTAAHSDPIIAYALLLGTAGLLPGELSAASDAETNSFVRSLWDNWWKMESTWGKRTMHSSDWHHGSSRPQNNPVRRLAAAATMFTQNPTLIDRISAAETTHPTSWQKNINTIIKKSAAMPYWQNRLNLGDKLQSKNISLLGPHRITSILSNVVIPFLAATNKPITGLPETLPAEQSNAIIKQAAHALLSPDHNPAIYNTGLRQQGLIQIFHDFCLNNRTGCSKCALAQGLQQQAVMACPAHCL